MKNLIFILIILIGLIGCKENSTVIVTDNTIPVIIEDPEPITSGQIIISWYDSGSVKFYDSSAIYTFKTGESIPGEFQQIITDTVIYTMDYRGEITGQETLPFQPNFYAVDKSDNAWSLVIITPDEAYNSGALYKYYAKIYKNNVEYGDWTTRQYQAINMFLSGDDIIAVGATGEYYCITSVKNNIISAVKDGFIIYDRDSTLHTFKINGVSLTYGLNYFLKADYWTFADGKYYSQNGYTWDGTTLGEGATALDCWNYSAQYPIALSESPVVISAGYSIFNEEKVLFFIECNSGWLFRYIPKSDMLIKEVRLYTGDGTRAMGNYYANILNPIVGRDGIYFLFDDGGIYKYRFDNGLVSYISEYTGWMVGWEAL